MDISVNNRPVNVTTPTTPETRAAAEAAKSQSKPALVITEARPNILSGPDTAEDVPESALRRDDSLGKLFTTAFNLPAPPMPTFPS